MTLPFLLLPRKGDFVKLLLLLLLLLDRTLDALPSDLGCSKVFIQLIAFKELWADFIAARNKGPAGVQRSDNTHAHILIVFPSWLFPAVPIP